MPRRERQRAELLELSRAGAVSRAIDLAFQHFADYGRDDEIVAALAIALERTAAPRAVRRRFDELPRSDA